MVTNKIITMQEAGQSKRYSLCDVQSDSTQSNKRKWADVDKPRTRLSSEESGKLLGQLSKVSAAAATAVPLLTDALDHFKSKMPFSFSASSSSSDNTVSMDDASEMRRQIPHSLELSDAAANELSNVIKALRATQKLCNGLHIPITKAADQSSGQEAVTSSSKTPRENTISPGGKTVTIHDD
jgi:hypothetical protein